MKKIDTCDKCNGLIIFIETPQLTHYGKEECSNCGKWFRWVKNPENIGIRTKTSKHSLKQIYEYRNFNSAFCFICLRDENQLGKCEVLTRDHIEELDKGGKDKIENLQILCTACHKLKNWARLYMNWHLK